MKNMLKLVIVGIVLLVGVAGGVMANDLTAEQIQQLADVEKALQAKGFTEEALKHYADSNFTLVVVPEGITKELFEPNPNPENTLVDEMAKLALLEAALRLDDPGLGELRNSENEHKANALALFRGYVQKVADKVTAQK